MRLELGLNQGSLRRWQVELARRLREIDGLELGIRWSKPVGEELPSCVGTLLGLERVLHGIRADLSAPAEPSDLSPHVGRGGVEPDLLIDLSGGLPAVGRRRWRLTFDGGEGDAPILAALLSGRAPLIAISESTSGAIVANARLGLADPSLVAAGFESVLARTVSVVVAAVRGGAAPLHTRTTAAPLACRDAARMGSKALAAAVLARLSLTASRPSHSRTGWRFLTGPDVIDLQGHPPSGWRLLRDDGRRSFAHPFPIITRSEPWLFVSERQFETGRSLISAVRLGAKGPLDPPRPVFELEGDVAYPSVFEAEGNIWMIPERRGAGSIDLYRASRFPGGWRHEACLVPDVEARCATPFRFGGRWWLSATVLEGASTSDMLYLWSAWQIRGPWTPHAANPVLIDARASRPAGRPTERSGRLIRPAQDRTLPGRSLVLAEILRLTDDTFEQRIIGEIAQRPGSPGHGISTLNRAGSIECIDEVGFGLLGETIAPAPVRTGRERRHPPELASAS